jgi:hypothetical protein
MKRPFSFKQRNIQRWKISPLTWTKIDWKNSVLEKRSKVVFTWAALALFTHGLTELVLATVCRHLALLVQSLQWCDSLFKGTVL